MEKYYLNSKLEIGIDEAGRGPLIGRVYAGAVIWGDDTLSNSIINDSKKLSAKKRGIALEWIKSNVKAWGVGWAEPEEVDKINILEATKLAMERALQNLITNFNLNDKPITLIIDGSGWEKKFTNYEIKSIIKGDAKFLSIAAASIIAKEFHDEYIKNICLSNPELNEKYDLLNNMGYGTKKHLLGLEKYGGSDFHRKSFKPLKNCL
jgi:ribonuclease HII